MANQVDAEDRLPDRVDRDESGHRHEQIAGAPHAPAIERLHEQRIEEEHPLAAQTPHGVGTIACHEQRGDLGRGEQQQRQIERRATVSRAAQKQRDDDADEGEDDARLAGCDRDGRGHREHVGAGGDEPRRKADAPARGRRVRHWRAMEGPIDSSHQEGGSLHGIACPGETDAVSSAAFLPRRRLQAEQAWPGPVGRAPARRVPDLSPVPRCPGIGVSDRDTIPSRWGRATSYACHIRRVILTSH